MNMRRLIVVLFLILTSKFSFCQDSSFKISPVEVGFGINSLTYDNNEIDSQIGFGVFVRRVWFSENKFNLVSGLLFEKTKYFDDYVRCGHYCHYKNMKFNIYSFSIPLMLRVNTGKQYKMFLETGPTFEIIPIKYGTGVKVLYPPMGDEIQTEISGRFEHDSFDIGANIGVGVIFPLNNYKIIMSSTFHSSISSVFESQHNDLSKYFSLKIGVLIN